MVLRTFLLFSLQTELRWYAREILLCFVCTDAKRRDSADIRQAYFLRQQPAPV